MSIQIENLTHVYMAGSPFEKKALDNVSLEIEDNEFVGIIGHTDVVNLLWFSTLTVF